MIHLATAIPEGEPQNDLLDKLFLSGNWQGCGRFSIIVDSGSDQSVLGLCPFCTQGVEIGVAGDFVEHASLVEALTVQLPGKMAH